MCDGTDRSLKVLLVNPTFAYYTHGWPPLGLGYLASALRRAGHEVRLYDPTPNHPDAPLITRDFRPDLVGISVVTSLRSAAHLIAKRIRDEAHIPVAVGGPDVTSCWQEHIQNPAIDFAVIGEGERTIVELAGCLAQGAPFDSVNGLVFKQGDEVVSNPPRLLMENMDEAPIPARDLLDMEWYRNGVLLRGTRYPGTTLMTARGCPWNCSFCDSRRTWTRRYRAHSVDRVIDEIVGLLRDWKVKTFQILDDTFPVNREHTLALCEALASHLRGIRWACQVRVDHLDEDVLLAMKEAGCIQVEFGVESGSDRVLKTLNKGFSVDQIRETFALCHKHQMRTYGNFIVGAPHETLADVQATFDLYREIRPNSGDLWIATPYPGTDLHAYCEEHGLLTDDFSVNFLHHGHELGGQCFIKSELTQADIERIKREFYETVRQDWAYA